MTKFVVDATANEIRGSFDPPLNFSVAGKYVIDVPDSLGVETSSTSVSELINAKVAAFEALHPDLDYSTEYDEVLSAAAYDPALSDGVMYGDFKRVCLLPGGYVFTTAFSNPVATKVFLHYYGFVLELKFDTTSVSPPPPRLLYNYESPPVGLDGGGSGFLEFENSDLLVQVYDSTGTSLVFTPTPDAETDVPSPPLTSYRLRFENTSSHRVFLSDWIFLTNHVILEV